MSENQTHICVECNSIIVGQVITFKANSYDEECFNKKYICCVCQKPLNGEKIITIENEKMYHPNCFKCEGCKKLVNTEEGYAEIGSKIYCKDCGSKLNQQEEQKSSSLTNDKICDICGKKITGSVLKALDCMFHSDCFRCKKCNKTFDLLNFQLEDGFPYHQECHASEFGKKCAHCGKLITGNYINALGKEWHNNCFVCGGCQKPITGPFFDKQGKPYCEQCGKTNKK
ncbi:lim domain containing protein [Anaeramoeba flamelloides]|uniref:Lim domain containing protein n=1 Tax=Anaeramoeba flamelloides TaxID=1746091 RepID=A0AAV7ZBP9_9EUKA|nr:lim domain containing protein [Anaeramoeba flamelloides]